MKNIIIYLIFGLFFGTSNTAFSLEFPLPASNFVKAKMPMHLVYPRPDNETQSHARHRWAHPSMKFEIPIGVQGGAWPFKYEIIEGPVGAVIGEYYGDTDYGSISWTPTDASGTHAFKVRITDQELNTVEANWNVSIDSNQFIFIQDGYTGNKVGTISEPLEDVVDWYKSDRNDKTYHNKIIVFRSGNYSLLGAASDNYNIRLNANSKTPSLIGYPNETARVNASNAKILTDNGSLKDLFIAGIRWESSRQDVNNAHFFWAVGDVTRSTWWNNYFYDHGPGIKGTDNTTAVFVSSTDVHKRNILYKNNIHDNFHNTGSNGSYVDMYYSSYVLIEGNSAKNSGNSYGFWAKGTTSFVSIRANEAVNNITNGGVTVGYGSESPEVPFNHEVCWNRISFPRNNSAPTTLKWAMSNSYGGNTYNSFIYRNTFVNGSAMVRFKGNENYEVDANVVVSNNLNRWDTDIMTEANPSITGDENAEITDQTGKLVGNYRQNYLGKMGFEISDVEIVKVPKLPENSNVQ